MKENEKNPMMGMADQAMHTYEQAFQAGIKLQEETWQRCGYMWDQAACAREAQKRFAELETIVEEVMPVAQQSMEETWGIIGKNAQTSAELMKKAADAAQTAALEESQAKWAEILKMYLRATRSNADIMMQMGTRAIDSCIEIMQKNIPAPMAKAGVKS